MAVDMYPDPERRRNRGFLGSDSSALSAREKQASPSNAHPLIVPPEEQEEKDRMEHRLTLPLVLSHRSVNSCDMSSISTRGT